MNRAEIRDILNHYGFQAERASSDDMAGLIDDAVKERGQMTMGAVALLHLVLSYLQATGYNVCFVVDGGLGLAAEQIAGGYAQQERKQDRLTTASA